MWQSYFLYIISYCLNSTTHEFRKQPVVAGFCMQTQTYTVQKGFTSHVNNRNTSKLFCRKGWFQMCYNIWQNTWYATLWYNSCTWPFPFLTKPLALLKHKFRSGFAGFVSTCSFQLICYRSILFHDGFLIFCSINRLLVLTFKINYKYSSKQF